ncbi:MAG: hypothetical protein WCB27_00910 [Thermoguttaceae bacterium]|jgi:hypothetical protein
MNDGERRECKWIGKAGFAGGLATFVLGGIGFFVLARVKGPTELSDLRAVVGSALAAAIPGSVIGMIGTAARTPGRASLVGACLVGLPMLLWGEYREPISAQLWRIAGFAALGSILCQVGAVASGTAACGTRQPEKIQFTVRQFLMFFIPVAIYFGYLRTLMQK